LRVAVWVAAGWTLLAGVVVPIGWGLRLPALAQTAPMIEPMVAAWFTMCGTALLLLAPVKVGPVRRRIGELLGLAVAALCAGVLIEYATGRPLGIDNLLFSGALQEYSLTGRPAAYIAATLLVTGLALALLAADRAGGYRPAALLTALSAVLALSAFVGYLYGVPHLRGSAPDSAGTAPLTALTLLVLATGMLAARPDRPLVQAFNSLGALSRLARRLSPTVRSVARLREERDLIATLLSCLQEGVVVFDPDLRVRDVNPRWCRLSGWTRDELVGRTPPYPWWPPDQHEELTKLLSGGNVAGLPSGEWLIQRADGTPLWLLRSLGPIRGSDGKVWAYVGVYSDITRMKQADVKFRALLESAPDAMVCVDPSGAITTVNSRAEQLFGYPRAELVGQHAEMLVAERERDHPELRPNWLDNPDFRPQTDSLELTGRRRDGTEFPAEVSLAAIDTDEGVLVSAAIRDLTERKRNEDALRAEQEQTAAIITTATDPFVSIDQQGLVTEWNASAERVFGWSREQALGRPLTDTIIPPESADAHRRGLRRVVNGGAARMLDKRIEVTARHRDGHQIPVELAVWQGRAQHGRHVHALIHGITGRLHLQAERERAQAQAQRQEYERRLHQAQRLESLGQLAGGVAHDFNNLLAVIVNYLGFVAEEVGAACQRDPDRWKATREDISQVQQATERATRLTRQLLTFGRRDIAQPQVINLNELVAEMKEFLHRALGEQAGLVIRTTADLWHTAADRSQLEQILVNLAVNARDAMPGGGTLSIATDNMVADEQYAASHPGHPEGRFVRLRVSDTGAGMPPEVVDRAFEPFFTTKPDGAGTGLGLATVYGILTQAGGHATIHSEPGLGTTVNVLLPATDRTLTPKRPDSPAPAEPALASANGRTVLLIEDEGALREITRRILTRNGFRVIAAGDGAEAIRLAEQERDEIDLLLTDVVMPKMFGKAVANEIRARQPGVRVLFMSGYAQPVLASQGTLEPGVILLEKPFSEKTLLGRIRDVLNGDGH
jgi:PAS domain S-box-containing protein